MGMVENGIQPIFTKKNIVKCIVRLISGSYFRQESCIIWNSVKSDFLKICNEVEQGGVLTAVLYSMYIDPLLVELWIRKSSVSDSNMRKRKFLCYLFILDRQRAPSW